MEMEMEMASEVKNKSSNAKLSLEDYLLLLQSRSHLHLTVSHLNQIINMHGYKKIHKVHKKLLSDAVNSLDLVSPCRSTLKDYISPPLTTKLEDVTADLSDINWPECCIISIETLTRSSNNNDDDDQSQYLYQYQYQYQSALPRNGAVRFQQPSLPGDVSAPVTSKKRSVRKRKRTARVADLVNFTLG